MIPISRSLLSPLLLPLLFVLVDSGCPSSCTCEDLSVSCVSKGLESVPSFESLSVFPAIVDLSGNRLSIIDNDDFTFDHSYAVLEVYLNNSEIFDIEGYAFDELENLQELYLGENMLNSIPVGLIEELEDVILLDVSGNYFSGDLPRLRSESLEVLAVANSKVTNVPDDALVGLPSLKVLLLQRNNIKQISPAAFAHIPDGTFFVGLGYNVWNCGCDTYRLFSYLTDRSFIDDYDDSEPYQCLNEDSLYLDIFSEGRLVRPADCEKANSIEDPSPFSLVKENSHDVEILVDDSCDTWRTVQVLGMSSTHLTVLAAVGSFLIGTLVGYVSKAILARRKGLMGPSESESKLLPISEGMT